MRFGPDNWPLYQLPAVPGGDGGWGIVGTQCYLPLMVAADNIAPYLSPHLTAPTMMQGQRH